MDPIKQAFDKIKQDISLLATEILELKQQVSQLKAENNELKQQNTQNQIPATPTHIPTQDNPFTSTPTHNPTHALSLEAPISQNIAFSTGNRGVPTDKPTDRQTNQQTDNSPVFQPKINDLDEFEQVSTILNSLDSIKKEIRLKFKRLTPQEMLVFSTLYDLETKNIEEITYKTLSHSLRLSESSIRDYITKLITKGIPILKIRQNNKTITLKISQDLQKIASLSTINKLREL